MMTATGQYVAPRTLEEVAAVAAGAGATILAGGTDLVPRWLKGVLARPAIVLDVKAVSRLNEITCQDGRITVGACTRMSELEASPIIRAGAPVLAEAAARVACPQIRNRATLGGNLCNASPAADTAIPLILLDAVVEMVSWSDDGLKVRTVPITDFFVAPGRTVLAPQEILSCIRFDVLGHGSFSAWDKFGTRPAMEIAVAAVGIALTVKDRLVVRARVGYGSVAPVPLRGRKAEAELFGQPLSDSAIDRCVAAARDEISPITDVRASASYRSEIVGVMLRRMLENARGS